MKETRENMNKAVELTKWGECNFLLQVIGLHISVIDINSNSAMSDQIKHNHLKAAHAAGDKAKSFVRDARKVSADVGEIREFTIPTGHMRMEVFYVNPVFQAPSDESVREAGQSVEAVYKTIEAEFLSATQRAARSRADLDEAANVVNDSRRNLEVYRQEVFDMVLLESQNDPLPLYSNIRQI
ncbi:hypothetical protein CPB85DRAFT_450633 [Mucidula mucida]|nr:hypothetical protein CPB85DRAFT_450633 [Mucidula mucida]